MRKLLIVSLLASLAGILALLIISHYQTFQVTGQITSIKSYGEFNIVILDKNQTITCTNCNLKINQTIEVTGKPIVYNNKKEIEAEKIKIT